MMPTDPPQPGDDLTQFSANVEEVLPRLLVWSRLRLRDRPEIDPEDFVQEVCTRAWSVRDRRDRDGPFGGWMFKIAKFVLLEALRTARNSRGAKFAAGGSTKMAAFGQIPDQLTTMSRRVARRIDARAFVEGLSDLDPIDEKILVLCGLEEMTPKDAAVQVGMSRDAVAKRWLRLRARLTWAGENED